MVPAPGLGRCGCFQAGRGTASPQCISRLRWVSQDEQTQPWHGTRPRRQTLQGQGRGHSEASGEHDRALLALGGRKRGPRHSSLPFRAQAGQ